MEMESQRKLSVMLSRFSVFIYVHFFVRPDWSVTTKMTAAHDPFSIVARDAALTSPVP